MLTTLLSFKPRSIRQLTVTGFLTVAGVLIVMNLGWLIQARGWLDQQKQRRAGGAPGTGARTTSPTRSERDRT